MIDNIEEVIFYMAGRIDKNLTVCLFLEIQIPLGYFYIFMTNF